MVYTGIARWVLVALAVYILVRCVVSLVRVSSPAEVWAYLHISRYGLDADGDVELLDERSEPITHWENVIGRAASCDIQVADEAISRNHGVLTRGTDGTWAYRDLGSKNGSYLEEVRISKEGEMGPPITMAYGDVLRTGLTEFTLLPISLEEQNNNLAMRKSDTKMMSIGPTMAALTLFQILTMLQLWLALGTDHLQSIFVSFGGLMLLMWSYVAIVRASGRAGFEMEAIAFFLSTLNLAVVASSAPDKLYKQFLAVAIGVAVLLLMCVLLRNLESCKRLRWLLLGGAALLLVANLALGTFGYGAKNWLAIGPVSFQPSELVKVAFIWIGAASLDELFEKKNLWIFMGFAAFCFGCLGLMGDFGTAAIFFVTFLVIAFLRSGEFSKLLLMVGAAAAGGFMILRFKPYVAKRFATWGHIWDAGVADAAGYQQTRTLSASASGGLAGVGAGKGWLVHLPAADTDMVFGVLIEEWGLDHRGAGGALHRHALGVRGAIHHGGTFHLLHDRGLRGDEHVRVPDDIERLWLYGSPAVYRRHVSVCIERRHQHDRVVGTAGIFEVGRYAAKSQSGGEGRRENMKKLERRAFLCLLMAAALLAGLVFFIARLEINGAKWSAFYANRHVYTNGMLRVGSVSDRGGKLLLQNDKSGARYSDDSELRRATYHVVGDLGGNVATAANVAFRSKLISYDPIFGTTGLFRNTGKNLTLTIDADINVAAYRALAGRNGTICVYNWRTGEILAMVSGPSADPAVKTDGAGSDVPSGTYLNKALSAVYTPGSVFKLVTTAAAIEQMEDLNSWTFTCTGSYEIDGEKITCPYAHGKMDFYGALANSCNGAFASLAVELGGETMREYTEKAGLTDAYEIDGIRTAAGSFNFDSAKLNIGWAGIGQFEDQVNPLAMMVYAGAIAGEGKAAKPVLLRGSALLEKGEALLDKEGGRARAGKVKLLEAGTARQISDMMRNNVKANYGDSNYPGLSLHAKTGTAEVGKGKRPHSWFVGFSGDYAFAVCLENSGYGATAAGPAANQVLQAMKKAGYLG